MNDEFLHRIRKTPPPEFLADLKTRLDRQPAAPPPRRRWTFTRGLLTGLMLGGAAFAITAVSLTGGRPDSLRSFVSAPMQALARLTPGGGAEHRQRDTQIRAAPLGPLWLPNHPAAGAARGQPNVPTAPASLAAQGNGVSNSVSSPVISHSGGAVSGGTGLPESADLRVLTASGIYPMVSAAAERATRYYYAGRTMINIEKIGVEIGTGIGNPFNRLCPFGTADVDVIELTRRITREEYDGCNGSRKLGVVEVKLGYQALALARGRLYGPLKVSARDFFLALARQVPDPNRAGGLINNPNATWNQVDGSLPYDPIQILGPATGSTPARLVTQLLLEPGCNTYTWIAALRQDDPDRYKEICGTLREDGAYVSSGSARWSFTDFLATNPTAIGIFSLNDLRLAHDGLVLNPIDGIEPGTSSIANGSYPAARSLYLYVRASGPHGNPLLLTFVGNNLSPKDLDGRDPDGWGFVALDQQEIDTALAIVRERREMKLQTTGDSR